MGLLQITDRRGSIFPGQSLAERPHSIKDSRQSRMPAEENQPTSFAVGYGLVLDKLTFQFHHFLQHRHVMHLTFNNMREENVRCSCAEKLRRDLFNGKHDRT